MQLVERADGPPERDGEGLWSYPPLCYAPWTVRSRDIHHAVNRAEEAEDLFGLVAVEERRIAEGLGPDDAFAGLEARATRPHDVEQPRQFGHSLRQRRDGKAPGAVVKRNP